jgi:Transposase DDE domain
MAIVIFYHLAGFKCFKYYYQHGILGKWKGYFPQAVSYNRFIELKKEVNLALYFFIYYSTSGSQTGTYFIDSTKLAVCDNHRIHSHKLFKNIAARGKTSTGWFYGLKLHLVVSDKGDLMSMCFSAGNVSDNNHHVVQHLCGPLKDGGKIFGDAGYISKELFEILYKQGIALFTKIRRNMKNKLMHLQDKLLLKKRSLVETIIDLLKNWMDLWHTRHRSIDNAFNNILSCLAAYQFLDKKPCLKDKKRATILGLIAE